MKKSKAGQFYDILTLIYCNYELNLYENIDFMANDLFKLLNNYVAGKDLYIGFIK